MDADALIAEIATRHGVAVSRDDPVMILATLNELLADGNAKAQAQQLAQFKSEMEAISEKWARESKTRAQVVLTQILEASREAVAQRTKKGFEEIATATRHEVMRLQASEQQMKWLLAFNLLASLITFASACLVLLGFRSW